jgi:hypothetical protein
MTTLPTSYIDFNDLDEVMKLYFEGTLDDMDKYLPNLYKDLSQLHPSNSLFGQVCSDELTRCIWGLTRLERAALDYHYNQSEKSRIILTHIYLHESTSTSFESWVEISYIETMEALSFEIMQIL